MNQLITITENNGNKAVSARELHIFLESKQDFSTWIKNRISEYGFIENEDYSLLDNFVEQNKRGGHNKKEYAISVDMAKELSMVEKNDKGKQARRYFIAIEKQVTQPVTMLDKNMQHHTLLGLLKQNLNRGDIKAIAHENGFSYDAVRNIFYASSKRPEVIRAIFDKALANKKTIGANTQDMINELTLGL
ncbi:Toxin-antitoxin system, toxin component, Bro domain protein [Flavobacterium psychrophilum]|uniref:antA/AntB antirepressor family protein n=1 Tax=Flavobacterium psychrophilum TaxID=96345 RepID=UPI000B7C0A70|nr:antA/AntB antirepressor family protein [Flavobacterium psychrophilum]SNB26629.1 Toxin-antitoxin system, toxin component, Bro domain protein [Flavobacterium psychrophilum]